ncbi:hypothetical protein [Crossiella sp. NPDC003009]
MYNVEDEPGFLVWQVLGVVVAVLLLGAAMEGFSHLEQGRVVLTSGELVSATGSMIATLAGPLALVLTEILSVRRTGKIGARLRPGRALAVLAGASLGASAITATAETFVWWRMGEELRRTVLVDASPAVPVLVLVAALLMFGALAWSGVWMHRRLAARRAANTAVDQRWLILPR